MAADETKRQILNVFGKTRSASYQFLEDKNQKVS